MSSGRSAPTTDEVARYAERAAAAGIETTRTPREEATAAISAACRGETVATVLPFDVDLPAGATVDPTTAHLEAADTGVTAGTLAVAEYGTVVVTPTTRKEGSVSLLPERHVAVVRASDVVADMLAGFDRLVEAFAAGCPVLATDWNFNADIVTDGVDGRLFDPHDVAALSSHIEELADDPALLSDLQDGARQTGRQYSVERVTAGIIENLDASGWDLPEPTVERSRTVEPMQ